jgi:hypothetical protein
MPFAILAGFQSIFWYFPIPPLILGAGFFV